MRKERDLPDGFNGSQTDWEQWHRDNPVPEFAKHRWNGVRWWRWRTTHPMPPCFSNFSDWVEWWLLAEQTDLRPWRDGAAGHRDHCLDCRRDFAARMRAEGRCDRDVLPGETEVAPPLSL